MKLKQEILDQPYIKEFMEVLTQKQRERKISLSESSKSMYAYEVHRFYKKTGLKSNEKPTLEIAESWRLATIEKYARKTSARMISAINHYLRYCCGMPKDVLEQCPNITRTKIPLQLSRGEIMEIVEFLKKRGKHTESLMVYVCFLTASRKGTLHTIKLEDIDYKHGIKLKKCKGDLDILVEMDLEEMEPIKEYVQKYRPEPIQGHEDYLFINTKGKKPYEDRIRDILLYAGKELGYKVRLHPHSLRRALIMDLRAKGWTWENIMGITGHRTLNSIFAYLSESGQMEIRKLYDNNHNATQPETISQPQHSNRERELELENENLRLKLKIQEMALENARMERDNIPQQPQPPTEPRKGYY